MKEFKVTVINSFVVEAEDERDAINKYNEAIEIENGGTGEWPDWDVCDCDITADEF